VLIQSSTNLDVYGNTFGGNHTYSIQASNDSRQPDLRDIRLFNNQLNGDPIRGCSTPGITCENNAP
jgi:hypothetical protein